MGFAVHRPGIPEASPRSHRMPCGDVPGRIHVCVAGVSAGSALEVGLALARLRVHMPAPRATLAGEGGSYFLDAAWGLVLQSMGQQSPTGRKDRPIQSRFLADVVTGLGDGATRRASHVGDAQVLHADRVEGASETGARFLGPVLSCVSFSGAQPGDCPLYEDAAVRAALGSSQPALKVAELALFSEGKPRHGQQLARGQGRADRHAPVNANDLAVTWCRDWGRDSCESNVPPSYAVQGDPVGPCACGYRARPAEAHPASLWYPHLAGLAAKSARMPWLHGDNPESLIKPGLAPAWPAVRATEESRNSLGEVPKRLLLGHLAACPQPAGYRTGLRELSAHLYVPRCAAPSGAPPGVLLHREVPHVPRMSTMSPKHSLLVGRRRQAVARHSSKVSGAADIAEEVKRCGHRGIRAGTSTPQSR